MSERYLLRRISSVLLLAILSSVSLDAQTDRVWQAAVGLGAAANHHRQKGAMAAVGELSGRFFHRGDVGLSASATGGYFIPATDYVCVTSSTPSSCDLRVFSRFGALTLAANADTPGLTTRTMLARVLARGGGATPTHRRSSRRLSAARSSRWRSGLETVVSRWDSSRSESKARASE